MHWHTRSSAGRELAAALLEQRVHDLQNPIVFGLARGGMIVAAEVARALHAPLDVLVVRKLGLPFQPEVAMGALAPGVQVLDEALIAECNVSDADVQEVVRRETQEMQRRLMLYRGGRALPDLHDHAVLLVDDGLATGMTALAAVRSILQQSPQRVIVAAPVAARAACRLITKSEPAARCVCAFETDMLGGIGAYYEAFDQVTDDEVLAALRSNSDAASGAASGTASGAASGTAA